ncbi:MAG TPA: hypothetical protein H9754_11380, partial [Candidatus Anaerostipes avistercoris]|nr:hypothetical protein [Candidatus Anaerostipes avistercoris]
NRRCLYYNWKFWPLNVSLADRHLSHRLAAKYGTGGRLGWQSANFITALVIHNILSHMYFAISSIFSSSLIEETKIYNNEKEIVLQ